MDQSIENFYNQNSGLLWGLPVIGDVYGNWFEIDRLEIVQSIDIITFLFNDSFSFFLNDVRAAGPYVDFKLCPSRGIQFHSLIVYLFSYKVSKMLLTLT